MAVLVVTPPAPLVSLDEAKLHLRVEGFDEDSLIQGYIVAASAYIDGPFGILRRAVGFQTLEVRSNVFSGLDRLPVGPVLAIEEVKYIDTAGVEQTLGDAVYTLAADRFCLASNARWPSLRGDASGVRVRYTAGFEVVPASIQQAVLLLVGQWYEMRSAVTVGQTANEIPHAVRALLAPYKIFTF